MLNMANSHAMLVEAYRGTGDKSGTHAVKESWAQIVQIRQVLAEGADRHLSDHASRISGVRRFRRRSPVRTKALRRTTNPHLWYFHLREMPASLSSSAIRRSMKS